MAGSKYVVLSDAVVVAVGKKADGRPSYTRVLRGGVLNGSPESEQIRTFLSLGAVLHVKSKEELAAVQADLAVARTSKHRQTPKRAAIAAGIAVDDPALRPDADFEPLPAPLPETNPDAILAEPEPVEA